MVSRLRRQLDAGDADLKDVLAKPFDVKAAFDLYMAVLAPVKNRLAGVRHLIVVPDGALQLAERVAKQLGVDHAGFDIAQVDGHFYLFEFNVRFGTEALNARGIRLGPLIFDYLQSVKKPPLLS